MYAFVYRPATSRSGSTWAWVILSLKANWNQSFTVASVYGHNGMNRNTRESGFKGEKLTSTAKTDGRNGRLSSATVGIVDKIKHFSLQQPRACILWLHVFRQLNVFSLRVGVSNSKYKTSSLFDLGGGRELNCFFQCAQNVLIRTMTTGSGIKIYFFKFRSNTYCFSNKTTKPLCFYFFIPSYVLNTTNSVCTDDAGRMLAVTHE